MELTENEIRNIFETGDWANRPILTLNEVAELLRVPKGTLYDWRSRGLLDRCSRKAGKQVLFVRDRLIQVIFNEGILSND